MTRENKKKNEKIKMNRFFMIGCHALLAISAVVLIYLYGMRKNLIEDCKQELLEGVSRSAREVSNRIENKFITLETIQDLVSRSYEIGQESAEPLESARERYAMSSLGVVDKNYIYYDSSGESVPDISHEQIDRVFSGAKTVICSTDGYAPDGLVFAVPYRKDGEIIGAICSKYPAGDLIAGLESKVLDVAELIVDSAGNLVFSSNDFGEYIGNELTWEEVSRNGVKLTQKKQFDDEMLKNQSAVSSAKNRLGERIYFAAARVMSYNDFYVIHFTNSKIVEEKIQNTMLWAYLMLALMTMCMIFLIVGAAVTYSKNRKKIYREAYENPLTKIPAKTKHKLDAQELIDKQENKYAYVTFDIDNFKYINEVFGYEYGNRVLIHIANVIKEFASEKELYAHISGDNFALLLIDEGTEEELSQRIQKLFTTITESQGEDSDLNLCKLKISCGVYRIEGATDINHVRANANIARTECKKQVLHDIVYYDEALKARRVEERELEYDAEDALKNGEFLVYFQPKYDVATERIIGAEALIRWNHSVRGMLSPGIFVPLFETTGFIIELDMYVLEQVCKLIAAWLKKGITPVCISVNLSRTHLYEQNLVKRLVSVVKKYNVPPNYIEFELTESAFYEQSGTLLQVMEDIKREGFRLSMDDFGSGYSSLNLLRRLPVDVLKLDKEFLAEDGGGDDIERGKRIVMHVISMAKDLEISVLAEGVETKGDKDFLQEARCDMIQGYYFAKPMPMSEFDSLYTEKDSNILLEKG